jgi:phasin family protein
MSEDSKTTPTSQISGSDPDGAQSERAATESLERAIQAPQKRSTPMTQAAKPKTSRAKKSAATASSSKKTLPAAAKRKTAARTSTGARVKTAKPETKVAVKTPALKVAKSSTVPAKNPGISKTESPNAEAAAELSRPTYAKPSEPINVAGSHDAVNFDELFSEAQSRVEEARARMEELVTEARVRFDEALSGGREGLEEALKNSSGSVQEALEKVQERYDDLSKLNRDTVEALVDANQKISHGFEEFSGQLVDFVKSQMNDGVAHAKRMSAAKTLSEFVEIQSDFVRKSMDTFASESSKLGEMAMSTIQATFDPFRDQVKSTWERIIKRD